MKTATVRLALLAITLLSLPSCQTWVERRYPGGELPSARYIEHPPRYDPKAPLSRELASMERSTTPPGNPGPPSGSTSPVPPPSPPPAPPHPPLIPPPAPPPPTAVTVANLLREEAILFTVNPDGGLKFVLKLAHGEAVDLPASANTRFAAVFQSEPYHAGFVAQQGASTWLLRPKMVPTPTSTMPPAASTSRKPVLE